MLLAVESRRMAKVAVISCFIRIGIVSFPKTRATASYNEMLLFGDGFCE